MKKIYLVFSFFVFGILAVSAQVVVQTDLKDWKNVDTEEPPAVQSSRGTFNLTAGQITLSGPTWMRNPESNEPDLGNGAGVGLPEDLKYIRFGGNMTITAGVPDGQYIEVKNANVPFVNGGTITALVSANGSNRELEVYSVELATKVGSIMITSPHENNLPYEVTANLLADLNGVHTLRIGRVSSGPFLWGLTITTGDESSAPDIKNETKVAVNSEDFDITGRKVSPDSKGLVIKKITYEDGSVETIKSFEK